MPIERPPRIMLIAGESSGDHLAGALLADLKAHFPDLESFGVGGARMEESGFRSLCHLNELSVIGLVEVVRRLPTLIRRFRQLVAWMRERRPDLLITVDLPDFNFLLARRARVLGIPRIHYVGPQVWAWRAGRVRKLARLLDQLLVLFPFEVSAYANTSLPVTFVGHPLARRTLPGVAEIGRVRREAGVAADEKLLLLLPGSRLGEIRRHLGVMVEASRRVVEGQSQVRCVLALADTLNEADLAAVMAQVNEPATRAFFARIAVRCGQTRLLLAAADAALVASGTATLEAALAGAPMSVMYRVNRLTYEIGRRVVRVSHIALPNLVLGRGLVPERIQSEATPERLAEDARLLLFDGVSAARQKVGFDEIRARLAQPLSLPVEVVLNWLRALGFESRQVTGVPRPAEGCGVPVGG
ncbi:Lipid-A-disaccharide synthase [Candidatus Magnetaquicoccaceae bacterium FCR-1]|uniref:Lipid-A-disaccharide synthase n=1 Tax=Candidatus Magnetaquiglobus chichijimensis TaxID=3141448 RepID=A0ABQ0C650_9PROT